MLQSFQDYLLSVTAAALLGAILQVVLPAGPTRRVTGLGCMLLLFLVVVQPVQRANLEDLTAAFEAYWSELSDYPEELEETNAALTESIIVSRSEAYIMSRAQEEGADCQVSVACREESGIAVPNQVTVVGALTDSQQAALCDIVREGFGQEVEVTFTHTKEGEASAAP